ncbi:MAG: hypothetical protein NVV66_10920 [Cellulomonas sp.]|uniref:hypothetical protein n=1 Tax=Cellulomonas sp. TaxID=40001 RepID=UPI002589C750|nr:hypothetical protein [Cellulomonas sp.]MCR6705177.1 hypothetical protein [Cellulomonas sp.]
MKTVASPYLPGPPPVLLPVVAARATQDGEIAGGARKMTIEIMDVEEITATRIHLDPEAGGA